MIVIFLVMTLAYLIVGICDISFSVKPLDNLFFLVAFSFPMFNNALLYIALLNIYWRFKDFQKISKKLKSNDELKLLSKIYSKLNAILINVNSFYVLNTVLALLDLLTITITSTFLIYDVIAHSLPLENLILAGGAFIYIFTSGFICVLIIGCSSFIKNINVNIMVEINKIAMIENKLKVYKFCQVAILQIENTQNKITCGLFEFDWKLIFTFIATFFSYLWTMFQVDLMFNKKS